MAAVLPNPVHKSSHADVAPKPILQDSTIGSTDAQLGVQDKIPELRLDHGAADSTAWSPDAKSDRKPGSVQDVYADDPQKAIPNPDSPQKSKPITTTRLPVYWTKLPDRFPVQEVSLIPLPSGKPKAIPKIQHKFMPETAEARAVRTRRLELIKLETKRAWDAYRQYAFGHDELMPNALTFRDPFCGWGATLIDSLDSLWIMGLKEEFEDAYNGLKNMTFTTTFRRDIPVFETTIRYLGGLLAAYDVTGGHQGNYPLLLEKAVELAEILIGTFDTPNRMPVLYYQWQPAYASQAKRAHTRAGVAELGTLSMEFTRLAQLTGRDLYYDAIARITNALDEWQNREDESASLVPGIFPENIDASGCNKTAIANQTLDSASSEAQLQSQAIAPGEPKGYSPNKAAVSEMELRDDTNFKAVDTSSGVAKRAPKPPAPPKISKGADTHSQGTEPIGADGLPTDWECVPQNLTAASGTQSFGMGGSQDSAYEYFPKQYLLLGGLESKYRSLHEKTVAAVKEHLLYRPMTHDNADILFSAKLRIQPGNDLDLPMKVSHDYEVTHLACFLGGMFAMGGKIFESEEDVEIGRRLADGCVWAYSSMPSGIMAETAELTPCPDIGGCQWNDSAWYLGLDPNPEFREDAMALYLDNLEQYEAAKAQALRSEAILLQAEEELGIPVVRVDDSVPEVTAAKSTASGHHDAAPLPVQYSSSQSKGNSQQIVGPLKRSSDPSIGDSLPFDPSLLNQNAIEKKIKELDQLYFGESVPTAGSTDGSKGQLPLEKPQVRPKPPFKLPRKPHRPDTHLEYVHSRISAASLPPGYTTIQSNSYQLRPEAIESVWYMYRISGDPIWQEKGWQMWQSIIGHVRGDVAHSAISGVHDLELLRHLGSMESFWIAETLKYFYLLYSEPDVISLDDWVLNTEAHPFRRPS
ncbi:glycoside hydrolase [Coniella lustricola]|uniref:alpha-1,2-Mannosidase n=1 Tax=Coniella lustricola TaxID=2025994 RepID=A0A2T3A1D8_9PEZI|nr:glycoside hydrolase [Coniella lustricola]